MTLSSPSSPTTIAPPLTAAELPLKLLLMMLVMLNSPQFWIAPPYSAELLLKLLLVTLNSPSLRIAPPSLAELSLKALLVTLSSPMMFSSSSLAL